MPSPIGHALAGAAAAWLICPPPRTAALAGAGRLLRHGAPFAAVALLPDLDLIWGNHSGQTHGLGAAVVVGFAAWALVRHAGWQGMAAWRVGLAAAAAYASHTLLDWLGSDTSAPIGIMALWPLSDGYFQSDLHVFMAISRRYWREGFLAQNVAAVTRELLILVPLVAALLWIRCYRRSGVTEMRTRD